MQSRVASLSGLKSEGCSARDESEARWLARLRAPKTHVCGKEKEEDERVGRIEVFLGDGEQVCGGVGKDT